MCRIGIDPSICETGVAVVDNSGALLFYTTLRPVGEDISTRLAHLESLLVAVLDQFAPDRAVVERAPSFSYDRSTDENSGKGLNAESIQKNGYAFAAIVLVLGRRGIPVTELWAHKWKMCAGRNTGKDAMVRFARALFPALKEARLNDHEAEAICMVKMYGDSRRVAPIATCTRPRRRVCARRR